MSGTAVAAQIAEHGPWGAFSALVGAWVGQLVRDWLHNRKPMDEKAGSVVDSFATLTDHLERRIKAQDEQIETMRVENHKNRNDLQKVRAYADLVLRWAARLEDQVREAGMTPEPRPEMPQLS